MPGSKELQKPPSGKLLSSFFTKKFVRFTDVFEPLLPPNIVAGLQTMRFCRISNAKIANLTLLDSKGFHMSIQRSSNVTVRDLNISAPENSRNTDGIHVSGSNNIDLASLTIGTGDDCISIGQGSTNVFISNVACGPGHGISIGSLGKYNNEKNVAGVNVRNCTISGTTNGVRIKTWPGAPPTEASDITFEDIVAENVSNAIIIDQEYCPVHHCSNEVWF
ncbi:putative Exopolygalacturonase [Cocos nucifera]|uniref:Putative Exopolygalacturonase n=1 Tax=Cocos nucifera TaxID=13894 RepID=A0A8K0J0Y7_COCNU|nr:putative Exopolygalacturonase [Cocos nucifera]